MSGVWWSQNFTIFENIADQIFHTMVHFMPGWPTKSCWYVQITHILDHVESKFYYFRWLKELGTISEHDNSSKPIQIHPNPNSSMVNSGGSRIFLRGAPTPKFFAENFMKMKEFGPQIPDASLGSTNGQPNMSCLGLLGVACSINLPNGWFKQINMTYLGNHVCWFWILINHNAPMKNVMNSKA